MLFLEHKFVGLLSPRLDRFVRKSGSLYNFRCPLCGDSSRNERKLRGYIYQKGNGLKFFCHNCNASMPFPKMLAALDARLYGDFILEKIKAEGGKLPEYVSEKVQVADFTAFESLKAVSQLKPSHPAWRYLKSRQTPEKYLSEIRWVDKFMTMTNELLPGKFPEKALKYDAGRIVIPFFSRAQKLIGYQGRIIDDKDDNVKYISIALDNEEPQIWGVDKLNFNRDIVAFEGPLDAMFISNAVAFAGGNYHSLTKGIPYNKIIVAYDNEPHSKHTKEKIHQAIANGMRVVIWPDNIAEKDINKMVESGYSTAWIEAIILNNIYQGLTARLRLSQWSKV